MSVRCDSEAAARQPIAARTRRAAVPVAAAEDSSQVIGPTAGIHAVPLPIRRSKHNTPPRRNGPYGGNPVERGKAGVWSEKEENELRRLVPSNVKPSGMISWDDAVRAWLNLNLPPRTKASLSSKWQNIKNKPATVITDPPSTGRKTELRSKVSTVPSDTTVDVIDAGSNSIDVNPTVEGKPGQCEPADPAEDVVEATFRMEYKKAQKIGCRMTLRKPPNRVSGRHIKPIICIVDRLIKRELEKEVRRVSWNTLSNLVFAGAATVSKIGNGKSREK
ncbi:unnamed protein product [Rotaria socialis]|nr:unnamed protein product [Rotaria socialis]CAF4387705.1 unnamed protein product [Rotaria socialis]CAF4716566.1 unnamed protein product [Rotaria socialis]